MITYIFIAIRSGHWSKVFKTYRKNPHTVSSYRPHQFVTYYIKTFERLLLQNFLPQTTFQIPSYAS